jgi:hypothetical protein
MLQPFPIRAMLNSVSIDPMLSSSYIRKKSGELFKEKKNR